MTLEKEAVLFTKYLTGTRPSTELIERYVSACVKLNLSVAVSNDKLLQKILRWPLLLPYVDAAISFGNKKTILRKKILVMLAILETTPEFYGVFASKKYSFVGWLLIFLRGIWAIIKFILGSLLLLLI